MEKKNNGYFWIVLIVLIMWFFSNMFLLDILYHVKQISEKQYVIVEHHPITED